MARVRLPANPFVVARRSRSCLSFKIHQIDDNVAGPETLAEFILIQSAGRDHDDLGVLENLCKAGRKQRTDVRDHFFNVLAVGAYQLAQRYIVIPDPDLPALAALRQSLRQRVAESAIGDSPRYARAVEAAYRAVWRRWCAAQQQG